jgi:hypothetical protein
MNQNTTTTIPVRDQLESDIIQQVRNEVQETLLLHAPDLWADERLDVIEQKVLDNTRIVLASLSIDGLRSPGALQNRIVHALTETKRLIRGGGK